MNYHYHHFFLFWKNFSTFSNFFLTIMIKKRQRTEIARERIVGYFIEIIIVEIKRRHLKGHLIIKLASGEQHANSKWHEEEKWNWNDCGSDWFNPMWCRYTKFLFRERPFKPPPLKKSKCGGASNFLQKQSNCINF